MEVHGPGDLWVVKGDVTQLHQVLLNLCINARDAMPSGGILRLSGENRFVDPTYASMTPQAKVGPYVVLKVEDSGKGIPPELLDRIFDPFFTTKPEGQGTGLGLATVSGIVKSHGGFLEVTSKEGQGTVFTVFLPASPEQSLTSQARDGYRAVRGQGEGVLVVEDEQNILDITCRVLAAHGYCPVAARDGAEALALLMQQNGRVKLVLTDVCMPIMDGLALLKVLRRMDPKPAVIVMTGQVTDALSDKAPAQLRERGIEAILAKPFTTEQLLTVLAETLQKGMGSKPPLPPASTGPALITVRN